jgi:hypothetical protein
MGQAPKEDPAGQHTTPLLLKSADFRAMLGTAAMLPA